MAHLVESMMYVGKEPWHGLGRKVPEEKKLKIGEAIIAAGLNWDVELRHLFTDDRPETGGKELIPNVAHLLEHGRGSKQAGKTYWGAYNAVTEYLNYFRGKTQDNRLSSLWFGDRSQVNRRALDVAIGMAV